MNLLMRLRRSPGFTLIELMIAVSIVGLLASVAIPNFLRFQLRSRTAEAKTNLNGIRTAEEAYAAEHGSYISAPASPAVYGGAAAVAFVDTGPAGGNFDTVGWRPEGRVYFQYSVVASPTAYTAEAAADIDADSVPQLWGYFRTDVSGVPVAGVLGCPGVWDANGGMANLTNVVGPCGPEYGQSEF